MKSIAGFICFVSLFCSAAHGEIRLFNKPYDFSLAPQAGVLYGTAYEIVYHQLSNEYLSELQWELKPLFVLGIEVALEPVRTWGFFADLTINAGLPFVSGTMVDRDWNNPGILSNFSSHTNKTQAAVLLTLDAGFSFPATEWFFLRPFVSFEYLFFKMEGRDGYYSYASNDWETGTFSGPVIRYVQHWFLLSPGFSMGFILNRFTIKGAVKITPFIFCIANDDHLLAKATFTDYMSGTLAVEPALDISFAFSSRFAAGLSASYRFITRTRGNTIVTGYGQVGSTKSFNSSGAGLRLLEGTLYLKARLGKR